MQGGQRKPKQMMSIGLCDYQQQYEEMTFFSLTQMGHSYFQLLCLHWAGKKGQSIYSFLDNDFEVGKSIFNE